jgi:hypothetical protein
MHDGAARGTPRFAKLRLAEHREERNVSVSTSRDESRAHLGKEDALFAGVTPEVDADSAPAKPDPSLPTAVLLVGKHRGASMHALLWVNRLFPGLPEYRLSRRRRSGCAKL